jgi:ABC-type dipeptide/oligopeptide/nickel transport system ATPase component
MAEMIAIVGESGSGKTTSIRNLNPEETFIISTTGKRPGIKGAKKKYPDFKVNKETKEMSGNFYTSSNIEAIKQMMKIVNLKMPNVKVLVIDDFQYLQAFEAMARVDEKGYGKFTDMAKHAYEALKTGMDMRDDLFIVVSTHSENTGDNLNPYYKIKTQGKMLDSVITLEGLFTYVLFTKVVKDDSDSVQYKFLTNSDGTCTAKSPMGLFEDLLIDNDLDYVIKKIKEYNEGE